MKPRTVAGVGLFAVMSASLAASCSLGLDESRIGQSDGAAVPTATGTTTTSAPGVDGVAPDAPVVPPRDATADGRPSETCTRNEDCVTSALCQKGRCDTASKRCFYDLCPQADRCRAAACSVSAAKCDAPEDRAFDEEFSIIDQPNAVGPFRGIAIVQPFVFVGTASGVYAYSLQEVGLPKTPIPIAGAAFPAQYLFASGRRLYIVGALQGSSQRRLALGWLDVPTDPAPAELRAESKFVSFNTPSMGFAFPYPGERLLLGQQSSGAAFGISEPPFGSAIALQTAILPSGTLVTPSGDRLVFLRAVTGTNAPVLSLITGAGTATPNVGADQSIQAGSNAYYNYGNGYFATSPMGAVAMSWSMSQQAAPYNGNAAAVRVSFILKDDKDTAFSTTDFVDYHTFPAPGIPNHANLAGPIAWADENTLLATFAAPSAPTTRTTVAFLHHGRVGVDGGVDGGVSLPGEIAVPAGNVQGVAAAPGIGALLTSNSGGGGPTVHIIRQGCAQ